MRWLLALAFGVILHGKGLHADEILLEPRGGFEVGAEPSPVVVGLANQGPRQGFQFQLAYDPAFLRPTSVTGLGRLLDSPHLHYSLSTPGVVRVLVYDRRGSGWSIAAGKDPLVAVGFEAVDAPPHGLLQLAVVHGLAVSSSDPPIDLAPSTLGVSVAARKETEITHESGTTAVPLEFGLEQNHPNPFADGTAIRFDVPRRSVVRIAVYDLAGRLVRVLVDEPFAPGRHTVAWNTGGRGRVAPGIFFYVMDAEGFRAVKKLVRLE